MQPYTSPTKVMPGSSQALYTTQGNDGHCCRSTLILQRREKGVRITNLQNIPIYTYAGGIRQLGDPLSQPPRAEDGVPDWSISRLCILTLLISDGIILGSFKRPNGETVSRSIDSSDCNSIVIKLLCTKKDTRTASISSNGSHMFMQHLAEKHGRGLVGHLC